MGNRLQVIKVEKNRYACIFPADGCISYFSFVFKFEDRIDIVIKENEGKQQNFLFKVSEMREICKIGETH